MQRLPVASLTCLLAFWCVAPSALAQQTAANGGERCRASRSLQRYEIDQLRLIHANTESSLSTALLIDPTGKTLLAQIGDCVGRHHGRLSAIAKDEITVTEIVADRKSGRVFPVSIPLRTPNAPSQPTASPPGDYVREITSISL